MWICAQLVSRVWLFRDPQECSTLSPAVHGMFQARILEWVAISFSRASSQLGDWTWISCVSWIAGGFFTITPPGKYGHHHDQININRWFIAVTLQDHPINPKSNHTSRCYDFLTFRKEKLSYLLRLLLLGIKLCLMPKLAFICFIQQKRKRKKNDKKKKRREEE